MYRIAREAWLRPAGGYTTSCGPRRYASGSSLPKLAAPEERRSVACEEPVEKPSRGLPTGTVGALPVALRAAPGMPPPFGTAVPGSEESKRERRLHR